MYPIQHLYDLFVKHPIVCTDTRSISEGCLFFALKGENFNGNEFALRALEFGAAYAVVDEIPDLPSDHLIIVPDVLACLQQLARFHREKLNIPIVGLTGSNGKTTTKELIHAVLATQFKAFATKGNLNNHIGVPLSLLSISKGYEIAVIEMGANHIGEIKQLCEIARPTHGLITNIGMAHLEGFGGYEGVKKGKSELYDWLLQNKGIAFVNFGNPVLMELIKAFTREALVFYGEDAQRAECPGKVAVDGSLSGSGSLISVKWNTGGKTFNTHLNITGAYNLENVLSAIAIGHFFGVADTKIHDGLQQYVAVNNRSQIMKTPSNFVICDFYNANPSSMLAAIENLSAVAASSRIAILGDMFELGETSADQHNLVAETASKAGFDRLILIGTQFSSLSGLENSLCFETRDLAEAFLKKHPIQSATVLLKGSRGMALEKLLPLL